VAGMMKNKNLAKAIQEQGFYEFYRQIKYKAYWNNIKFIEAPRSYPSSKLCCICKNIKSDLKLSDRVYRCSCGNVIDRDYQASVNLYDYGKLIV
jgi:putative transposase